MNVTVAGVDPGFTMAGIVIKDGDGDILLSTTLSLTMEDEPGLKTEQRVSNHGQQIGWQCQDADILAIETPVYNRNPKTYALQCYLIGAIIQAYLAEHLRSSGEAGKVILLGPTQVKANHTGSGKAGKQAMVDAGSFKGLDMKRPVQEALADAEAICDLGIKKRAQARECKISSCLSHIHYWSEAPV